jgi:regulator of replication initiation timing
VLFKSWSFLIEDLLIPGSFFGRRLVKQRNGLPGQIRKFGVTGLFLFAGSVCGWAQAEATPAAQPIDAMTTAVRELQEEVRELREAVVELRSEAGQYRAETEQLRRELQSSRSSSVAPEASAANAASPVAVPNPTQAAPRQDRVEDRVAALEESSQLLNSKINDQYQTKIEAASKYRMRLSGIVLLNVFGNQGSVDNQDFPTWAVGPGANTSAKALGASLRQSEVGLEVFGPRLAGAKTTGNLQVDFSGGFTNTSDGVNFGLVRLRIASLRMDWKNTSLVAGQDNAFISPLSPTSFASLAVPAFGYAGNLWGWIPQVRVEHRFDLSEGQNITLQGGMMDNVTGELPYATFERPAQAGESSGQPAYGVRVSWTRSIFGMPLTLGTAGYYSRQNWVFNNHVDGWAGMTDWSVPLARRVSLTGEFYRGRAVGGLGGGVGRSVLFTGNPNPYAQLQPLNSVGGWSQLKVRASGKLEFNGAFGVDSPYAADVRGYPLSPGYFPASLLQNRSALLNFIYRPRSDLLFSGEYRHLRTFELDAVSPTADQVNLMMGILF